MSRIRLTALRLTQVRLTEMRLTNLEEIMLLGMRRTLEALKSLPDQDEKVRQLIAEGERRIAEIESRTTPTNGST